MKAASPSEFVEDQDKVNALFAEKSDKQLFLAEELGLLVCELTESRSPIIHLGFTLLKTDRRFRALLLRLKALRRELQDPIFDSFREGGRQ